MSKDIEVEAKYLVSDGFDLLKERVILFFKENAFFDETAPVRASSYLQSDTYYDTADKILLRNGFSLRIRQKGGKYFIACKKSSDQNAGQKEQLERFEREAETPGPEITSEDNAAFILQCFSDIMGDGYVKISELSKAVTVRNKRQQLLLKKAETQYEVAFDDVVYVNERTQVIYSEQQLEIEKCSAETSVVEMLEMLQRLEERLGSSVVPCWESKFERACRLTI